MQLGRKYRLRPTPAQARVLAQWIGCARVIYNRKADEERYLGWLRRYAKFSARRFAPDEGQSDFVFDQAYSHLKGAKTEEPWMHECPPQILRNAMYQRKAAWAKHWADPANVGRPGRRSREETNSVLLTQELFRFTNTGCIRIAGAKGRVVGEVAFQQHRELGAPRAVTVSRDPDGRWWLSFTFEDHLDHPAAQTATVKALATLPDDGLAAAIVGHDVGVVRAVTRSDGKVVLFSDAKLAKIAQWRERTAKLQRKLARQQKGSGKSRKTKRRIARLHSRSGDLRNDHAHQTSAVLAATPARVIAFEALKLRNMTRRPKPAPSADTPGAFAPNGASAKAGLNRSLLNQALGKIIRYTGYKAARRGKIVVRVPAKNSSRECSRCHHTAADNRQTQAQFYCLACGHTANADDNASVIVQQRATGLLFSVLGRSTLTTPEEAAYKLGLPKFLFRAAREPGNILPPGRSSHLAA